MNAQPPFPAQPPFHTEPHSNDTCARCLWAVSYHTQRLTEPSMTNTFRKIYRNLTDAEMDRVEQIKDAAERLEFLIIPNGDTDNIAALTESHWRAINLARINLEQAVMWAVKGHT